MRLRSRAARKKGVFWALIGLGGAIILFVSLPSWVLLATVGAGLIGGAYLGYKSGL